MTRTLKVLASALLVAFAITIMGRALPLRSFSRALDEAFGGFTRKIPKSPEPVSIPANQTEPTQKAKPGEQFTLYRDANDEVVCRAATEAEKRQMATADLKSLGMRPINHPELDDKTQLIQPAAAPNLTIILRATQQLQQNATASAAFTRAAQNWEAVIKSPITIYIDVDFGTSAFGQTFPSGVLGATATASNSYPYSSVRTNLIAQAGGEGNSTKQAIFNGLPANTVPTDQGNASSTDVADPNARAIGLLPATAQSADDAAQIGFNSTVTFDFDPSDGITAGQIDFDTVATHEIGHALGFSSEAGTNVTRPSVWDLYRFRTGTTTGTFGTAQRILAIGGSPDPLQFFFVPGNAESGLSNGGPSGSSANGADGWQSSHWKHVAGCSPSYIGIMDPAIPSGCRRVITDTDKLALTSFGYNLTNNNAPPPPPTPPGAPANDNFANAEVIASCTGSVNGTNFSATKETGEPSHDPPDATSQSPSHTVWYQWQAPSSGNVTITTAGSDFDTILAVYTGSAVNGLNRVVFNDDVQSGVIVSSTVTFPATVGTTYRIVVDGWGGDEGSIKLNWNCGSAPSPTPTPTPTPPSCPTAFIVNNSSDANDASPGNGVCMTSDGSCSLRAAIQESNALTSCGTININIPVISGPINIFNALPDISHNVNINGPTLGQITIQRSNGADDFRVFTISSGRTVTMSALTIANGLANGGGNAGLGGGIFNGGSLTLTNCNLYGNRSLSVGAGIYSNGASITLNNCNVGGLSSGQSNINGVNGAVSGIHLASGTLVMNGGSITGNSGGSGIGIGGIATLNNVTITNNTNQTLNGGGVAVFNSGTATIVNCLIANNAATGGQSGGGIYNGVGILRVINSTISGNSSSGRGGGIVSFNANTTLTNVTVTNNRSDTDNNSSGGENGGGINVSGGPTLLRNSIVAGNFIGLGANSRANDVSSGISTASAFNVINVCDNSLAPGCGLTNGSNNNQLGVSNPGLGILAANGGPTMTHALLAGSPAINAGSNALAVDQNGSALTTDQRGSGFSRIINGTVDLGAFETPVGGVNPIDQPDLFVRQHYLDFLSRQPDQSGWDFWTNQIASCGVNPTCTEVRRIDVSASFFLSIEFQNNGYLVERFYRVAYGNPQGNSTFGGAHTINVPVIRFDEFLAGVQRIGQGVVVLQPGWEQLMESNKQSFALEFVQTSRFTAGNSFPTTMTPAAFVDQLNLNAGTVLSAAERMNAINLFGGAATITNANARAQAVRMVAEDQDLYNAEYNRAFVLAEYYGYLRRNPNDTPDTDYTGYDFWLSKLNQFNGNYLNAEMVKAFLSSIEYRQRFGP